MRDGGWCGRQVEVWGEDGGGVVKRSWRWLWVCGAVGLSGCAFVFGLVSVCGADELRWSVGGGGSSVEVVPPGRVGAVAEIVFRNSAGDHGHRAVYEFVLGGYGFRVVLGGPEPDTLVVSVPEGYVAVPEELTLVDGDDGVVVVYPLSAWGF